MKKLLLTITVVMLFLLPTPRAKGQLFNAQLASMLQDSLNYYVSAITNIKGMSASVYLPNQGMWQGTAGESYAGQPITSDMVFGIASNTKLFVATAMLLLTENNIISLDDSLHEWLPSYANVNPDITIRQLLNHTSGVQDPIFLSPYMDTIMANPAMVFTPDHVLSWVGAPLFAPGTSWGYSNVNYILAGMVAQSATGMHISQIIRDSILIPLNLDSTFYDVEEPEVGNISHRWYNNIDYNDTSRIGLNTAGGCAGALFSTSADMSKWYHALMTGQVLSASSFAELTDFIATGGPPYTYGLGLESQNWFGHTTYGHGGSTWGYKSRMIYDPCMGAVVCGLVNSWPAGMDGVTLLLYRVLVNHVPGCGATITGSTTVCRGQSSVVYTVTPLANATSYVWTLPNGAMGSSNTNSITVNYGSAAVSGTITVRGNNVYGDGNISSLDVFVNVIDIGLTANGPTISVDSIADLYQWLDCNNGYQPISGATNQNYTALANGNYAVEISENGCTDTSACIQIIIEAIHSITGEENTVRIYPNPSNGNFILETNANSNQSVEIYNLVGDQIFQTTLNNSRTPINLKAASGVYFCELKDERNTILRKKIVVE